MDKIVYHLSQSNDDPVVSLNISSRIREMVFVEDNDDNGPMGRKRLSTKLIKNIFGPLDWRK